MWFNVSTVRQHLKNTFIPHEENDHRPNLFRGVSIFFFLAFSLALFAVSFLSPALVSKTDFIGSVYPAVLADLANEERDAAGVAPLVFNETLTEAAQQKADHMAQLGYFAHYGPDGTSPWHWMREAGYTFAFAGENLAIDFSHSRDVTKAWMESPKHRANILNGRFSEIGVAIAHGEYEGRETTFVVQMFGVPGAERPGDSAEQAELDPLETSTPQDSVILGVSGEDEDDSLVSLKEAVETDQELFVAVQDLSVDSLPSSAAEGGGQKPDYASWLEEFVVDPSPTVAIAYLFIGALFSIGLVLAIGHRAHIHQPRNVFFGILLLVVVVILYYVNALIGAGDILISQL